MKLFSQQEIKNAFDVLPDDIRSVISAERSGNDVTSIAHSKNLLIDQAGILNEEIAFVMLGLVKTNEFEPRIKERLGLDDIKTKELTEEVNNRMFAPLRVSILKLGQEPDANTFDSNTPTSVKKDTSMDRSEILSGIEDAPPFKNLNGSMPIADKKLDVPIVTGAQKINIGVPKIDPYRESIE